MRRLNPPMLAAPFGRYSHGVEVGAALRWVRTSGQLPLSKDGHVPEGVEAQARLCFDNIDHILSEAQMARSDVVHISSFVTDRSDMAGYMAARDHWLRDRPETALPTSTLMIVSGFTRPEFLVEIEVWAAAP